jgi:hypothetical protein
MRSPTGEQPVRSDLPLVVQILHVPDCLLLPAAREAVDRAAASIGAQVHIDEVQGACPSPSVVVDGEDVTGRSLSGGACCRLDLPTDEQLRRALQRAMSAQPRGSS